MKRFLGLALVLALFIPSNGYAATVQLPGSTAWYEGTTALGTGQAPDTVEAASAVVPFASGYTGQGTTLRWSHASSISGYTFSLFASDSQTITSATPDFLYCWWVDVQLHPQVLPGSTKKARTWAPAASWDSSLCGWDLFPAFSLDGSDVSAWKVTESGGTATSGGSFMLNNGTTLRFVRVYKGKWNPATSKWAIDRRDNCYLSQLGRWASVAANDSQEKSGASLSPGFNTPFWYSSWPTSRTASDTSDITNGCTWSGTATAGNILATSATDVNALWASATATALADWTGGATEEEATGDDPWSAWQKDYDLEDIASQVGTATVDFSGWFWPLEWFAGWGD